jgi:hypothetical protein
MAFTFTESNYYHQSSVEFELDRDKDADIRSLLHSLPDEAIGPTIKAALRAYLGSFEERTPPGLTLVQFSFLEQEQQYRKHKPLDVQPVAETGAVRVLFDDGEACTVGPDGEMYAITYEWSLTF